MADKIGGKTVLLFEADASQLQQTKEQVKQGLQEVGQAGQEAGKAASTGLKQVDSAADSAAQAVKATGAAARGTAKDVQQVGASAAAAGKGMNDAARDADGLTAAQRRLVQQAERTAVQAEGGATAWLRHRAAMVGASDAVAPYLARIEAAKVGTAGLGVSAGQTAAAMRQLPAQFSDIVVSLQGGQAPLTVLLQQGSQIKDSFGGAGAAVKALGGYVTALVTPLTAVVAAIAAVGYGLYSGAEQSAALRTALVNTGNAAGMTAGQVSAMAEEVGRSTGSFGDARAAALQLVATGRLAGTDLQTAMRGVTDGVKATGKEVSELVAEFIDLGKDPVSALAKLNEQQHFLTAGVYAQVVALEQQGKKTEAATLAQKAYADSLSERRSEIVQNIGYIERAWVAVKSALSGAMDTLAGIGRDTALEEQVRRQINVYNTMVEAVGQISKRGDSRAEADMARARAGLQVERDKLLRLQEQSAEAWTKATTATAAKGVQDAGVAAVKWISTETLAIDKEAASRQKATEAVLRYTAAKKALDADPNGTGSGQIRDMLKGVTFDPSGKATGGGELGKLLDEYKKPAIDKGAVSAAASAAKNAVQGRVAAIEALLQQERTSLSAALAQQKRLLDSGAVDLKGYYDATYDARADSLQKQLVLAKKEEAEASGLKQAAAREKARAKIAEINAAIEQNAQEHADNITSISDKFKTALDAQIAKWGESRTAAEQALTTENAMFGQSADARQIATAGMKVEAEARKFLMDQAKALGPLTADQTDRVNAQAKAYGENAKQIEANTIAAKGAAQLLAENKRFTADSILDEEKRAAALLEIDADTWRERISRASEGSDERRRLEEQFNQWYSNQSMLPTINKWKTAAQDIDQDFRSAALSFATDGETKGVLKTFGKSLKATVLTQTVAGLYDAFARKWVINGIVQVAGALGGQSVADALSGKTAGTGLSDSLGTAKNALDFGNGAMQAYGGFSTGASTASMGYANAVQAVGGDGLGALIAGNGSWAGVPVAATGAALTGAAAAGATAAGGYAVTGATAQAVGALVGGGGGVAAGGTLAGAMSTIGAAMPYIGAAIAIYTLLSGSFKGEKRSGGTFNWADGQSQFLHGPSGGTDGKDGIVNAAISATASGVNDLLKSVGSSLSVNSLIAGFEGSEKGRGGVMSGVTLSDGRKLGEDGTGSNYKGTYYNKALPTTLTTEAAAGLLVTDLKQLQIEVLQSADDIPAALRKLVEGVNAPALTDEAATALLATVTTQVSGVKSLRAALDALPFGAVVTSTYDAVAAFIEYSGGVDAATNNLQSYLQNYTSQEEKLAAQRKQITDALGAVGIALPNSKAAFRAMVESLDDTTESGARAKAAMLGVNQAFSDWITTSDQVADAAREKAKSDADIALQPARDAIAALTTSFVDAAANAQTRVDTALQTVRDTYNTDKSALSNTISRLTSVIKGLDSTLAGLRVGDLSPDSLQQQYQTARGELDDLIAKALGGDEDAQGQVGSATEAFLRLSQQQFGATTAYAADFAKYSGDLARVRASAATQVDVAQQGLLRLDRMVEGIDLGNKITMSLADAIKELSAATAANTAAKALVPPSAGGGAAFTGDQKAIYEAYVRSGAGTPDAAGFQFWNNAVNNGASLSQIVAEIEAINAGKFGANSHASGLAFVPHDEYRMVGHIGEGVIDARTMQGLRKYGIPANRGGDEVLAGEVRRLVQVNEKQAALIAGLLAQTQRNGAQASTDVEQQTRRLTSRSTSL